MSAPEPTRRLTAEEFAALPDHGLRQELIEGEVIEMPPPFANHGRLVTRLLRWLDQWVDEHALGTVASDFGVLLRRKPDTVRAPDGAFYASGRWPGDDVQYLEVIPDLVFDVVSAHDRRSEVLAQVAQWVGAGVQVVWVVWPSTERVAVYGPGDHLCVLGRGDVLTCAPLLPGFDPPVDRLFG